MIEDTCAFCNRWWQ